ncbi:hypothetical protein LR48_Vigan07g151600 [Vigna angularis]|uniref:Uncharacterized protein n=1 Tax=Phaseolus angularis TaxID=3914 RepID=A0A0L9UYZ3_PHAAN|nr:hypothetical protein LR48_Vigan07g151600 [Vigna angularis]
MIACCLKILVLNAYYESLGKTILGLTILYYLKRFGTLAEIIAYHTSNKVLGEKSLVFTRTTATHHGLHQSILHTVTTCTNQFFTRSRPAPINSSHGHGLVAAGPEGGSSPHKTTVAGVVFSNVQQEAEQHTVPLMHLGWKKKHTAHEHIREHPTLWCYVFGYHVQLRRKLTSFGELHTVGNSTSRPKGNTATLEEVSRPWSNKLGEGAGHAGSREGRKTGHSFFNKRETHVVQQPPPKEELLFFA